MERRHFLKLVVGFVAGGVALNDTARAAPHTQPLSDPERSPEISP